MSVIYKYTLLQCNETLSLSLPKDAKIICAKEQDGMICLWAIVDPSNDEEKRKFVIFQAGENHPKGIYQYIDTIQIGSMVLHVFEVLGE